jgi:hypothetical protein
MVIVVIRVAMVIVVVEVIVMVTVVGVVGVVGYNVPDGIVSGGVVEVLPRDGVGEQVVTLRPCSNAASPSGWSASGKLGGSRPTCRRRVSEENSLIAYT